MGTLSNNNIAKAIYLISKEKEEKELPIFYKNVLSFLFRKRLFSQSVDILQKLEKISNQAENKIKIKIFSTKKLENSFKIKIIELLKKRYSGKEIILEEFLDQKLLGGIKIELENEILDLSIKDKIYKLEEHLTRKI